MITALVLTTDFKYKEVSINDYRDIRTLVGGNFEMIPILYEDIKIGKYSLIAYANESGHIENLPYNRWGSFLDEIGFYINHMYGIKGNVVILLSNDRGEDKSINSEVIKLFSSFKPADQYN